MIAQLGELVPRKDQQCYLPARASRGDADTKIEARVSEDMTESLMLVVLRWPLNKEGGKCQALAGSTEEEAAQDTTRSQETRLLPGARDRHCILYHAGTSDLSCWESKGGPHL